MTGQWQLFYTFVVFFFFLLSNSAVGLCMYVCSAVAIDLANGHLLARMASDHSPIFLLSVVVVLFCFFLGGRKRRGEGGWSNSPEGVCVRVSSSADRSCKWPALSLQSASHYAAQLFNQLYDLYVCRNIEKILFYDVFFSVSGWQCLSIDVVSFFVERCCFLVCFVCFVDCMYNCYDVFVRCIDSLK